MKVEILTPTRAMMDCYGSCKDPHEAKVPKYSDSGSMSSAIITVVEDWAERDWVTYITSMTSQLAASYDPATPQR
jgi:hypothetical protein